MNNLMGIFALDLGELIKLEFDAEKSGVVTRFFAPFIVEESK